MAETRKPIRSVLRALAVIETIGAKTKGISTIATKLKISKGTVFDLVKTLEFAGYIRRDSATEGYRLGPALMKIASAGLSNIDIVDIAGPHLRALADDIGEIVHLGRREGFKAAFLFRATSSRPGRMLELSSRVGALSPLHCTSMGKIFLAYMNDADALAFLAQPHEAYTERTICDARALRVERRRVREQGYALNLGEFEEGVSSIAVPLRTAAGEVIAGINFAVPSVRLPRTKIPVFVKKLLQTAKLIEADLHY